MEVDENEGRPSVLPSVLALSTRSVQRAADHWAQNVLFCLFLCVFFFKLSMENDSKIEIFKQESQVVMPLCQSGYIKQLHTYLANKSL